MPRYTEQDIKSASDVNLQEFAQAQGFDLIKSDEKSMKVEGMGGLFIFEKGFCHFTEEKKGNAIHFAREYLDMGFQDAVQTLLDFRGIQREEERNPPSYNQNNFAPKSPFKPKIKPEPRVNPQNSPVQAHQGEFRQAPTQQAPIQPTVQAHQGEFQQVPPQQIPIQTPMQSPKMEETPPSFDIPPPEEEGMYENYDTFFDVPPMSEHDSFKQENIAPKMEEVPKEEMVLPPRSSDNQATKMVQYLTEERCLDKEIVQDLMKTGQIFEATTKFQNWTFQNVAFVGTDKDNNPKYCSLRSMGQKRFTQDVKNSEKKHGFAMKGRSNRLFVCESPVDVISHATLTKMNQRDHTEDSRISLGGMTEDCLVQFLKDNPQITNIVFALDNDMDKVNKQGEPTNYGQLKAQKFAKEYGDKGFKTAIHTPKAKDFNEMLQQISKPSVKEKLQELKQTTAKINTAPAPQRKQESR